MTLCANTLTLTYEEFLTLYENNKNMFTGNRYKLKDGQTMQDLYNKISDDLLYILGAVEQIKEKGNTVSAEALLSIAKPQSFQTSRTTIVMMVSRAGLISAVMHPTEEGQKLQEAMSKAAQVVKSVNEMNKALDEGKSNLEALKDFNFAAMGEMLDILNLTESFSGATDDLAESALDKMLSARSKLKDKMKDNNSNYAQLMQSFGDTTRTLNDATSDDSTDEEKAQRIQQLMDNLTPGNADIISSMISPKLLKDQGVPEEYSEKTSQMIKKLFVEMGDVVPAHSGKEANAVKYLFDIGMASKHNPSTPLFGENGKIKDKNDFVKKCLDSSVVTKTIRETAYDKNNNLIYDPIGLKSKISEEVQLEIIGALNKYAAENLTSPINAGTYLNIVNFAAMFNIETTTVNSKVYFNPK